MNLLQFLGFLVVKCYNTQRKRGNTVNTIEDN